MADVLISNLLSAGNSEERKAMASHPVIKGVGEESSEIPASREEDGGSQASKLPPALPATGEC